LLLYTSNVDVRISVCCTPSDKHTIEVIDWFYGRVKFDSNRIHVMSLTKNGLFRRGFARNEIALSCSEDVVWFADVDMAFGEGCLDSLLRHDWGDEKIIYPRYVNIQETHAQGDEMASAEHGDFIDVKDYKFAMKRYNRAIGGVQIVQGDFAREHGYLNNKPKRIQPRNDERPFPDFKDDVIYRQFCVRQGGCLGIDIENVYRFRHTPVTYK